MKQTEDFLHVQMFGNFQMKYGGKPLTGEKRRDTYFTSLMQILLHNVKKGVSRDVLEDILLGDRDIENRHQALQTIIYKAKRKLKSMGLPEVNYIFLDKGIYHWTPEIPVKEDAEEFERLYVLASKEEEEDERLQLYRKAVYTYTGEFLSAYAGVMWVGSEARRYSAMFCECAERAAAILRENQDWTRLEKLGNRMKHSYEILDQIQENLMENEENMQGGYQCSFPVFSGIYHVVNRMMERGGQSVYLMLCTVVDGKGNPMKEGKRLEELSERLGEAIRSSLRRGDILNRYGSGQFLVLLINITRENCGIIERRINQKFMAEGQRTGVQYHINSVICEA